MTRNPLLGTTEAGEQEAHQQGTIHRRRRETGAERREKAEVTETPDSPESPAPPHLAALRLPLALAGPPELHRLTLLQRTLQAAPFYNKKFSNLQLRPLTPIPTPLSDTPFISSLTPTLHLFDFDFLQWIFLFFHLPEPDSYPTHETPICTPEGPTTINVVERRRWKKKNEEKEQMKNADLILFFIYFFELLYNLIKKFFQKL